jgi:uncharacterized membrane-anchored protein
VKSQLPSAISHLIKRLTSHRKEIVQKTGQFHRQIQAMNDLYTKINQLIQQNLIEQLKSVTAKELNETQIETVRQQYQLLLKQIQ